MIMRNSRKSATQMDSKSTAILKIIKIAVDLFMPICYYLF